MKRLYNKLLEESKKMIDIYMSLGMNPEFRGKVPTRDLSIMYASTSLETRTLRDSYNKFVAKYPQFINDYQKLGPNWKKLTLLGFAVLINTNDKWFNSAFSHQRDLNAALDMLHVNTIAAMTVNSDYSGEKVLHLEGEPPVPETDNQIISRENDIPHFSDSPLILKMIQSLFPEDNSPIKNIQENLENSVKDIVQEKVGNILEHNNDNSLMNLNPMDINSKIGDSPLTISSNIILAIEDHLFENTKQTTDVGNILSIIEIIIKGK